MRAKYHHGDLAAAARRESAKALEMYGIQGFTLRRVAQRLGVDHKALYQHYESKEALLGAVAEEGYRVLAERMRSAVDQARNPVDGLRAMGRAYVSFCVNNSSLAVAMHGGSGLELDGGYPPLRDAHDQVLAALIAAVSNGQRAGALAAGRPEPIALALWTFAHGYVDSYRLRQGFFGARFRPPATDSGIVRHFDRVFKRVLEGFAL